MPQAIERHIYNSKAQVKIQAHSKLPGSLYPGFPFPSVQSVGLEM